MKSVWFRLGKVPQATMGYIATSLKAFSILASVTPCPGALHRGYHGREGPREIPGQFPGESLQTGDAPPSDARALFSNSPVPPLCKTSFIRACGVSCWSQSGSCLAASHGLPVVRQIVVTSSA